MPFVRTTSFWTQELYVYARSTETVDFVATETFGNNGVASFTVPCDVRYLNAHEREALSREQAGATIRAQCDLDVGVEEHDRAVWNRDPGWMYEIVGVNRVFEIAEVLLRRVNG